VDPACYDVLVIPGSRFVEWLVAEGNGGVVTLVKAFIGTRWPIVVMCHSRLLVAVVVTMAGVWCTTFFSLRLIVELAGGRWVEPDPFEVCTIDGHVLMAVGWPAHAELSSMVGKGWRCRWTGMSMEGREEEKRCAEGPLWHAMQEADSAVVPYPLR
jgi:putative intracellular protease/amidase